MILPTPLKNSVTHISLGRKKQREPKADTVRKAWFDFISSGFCVSRVDKSIKASLRYKIGGLNLGEKKS